MHAVGGVTGLYLQVLPSRDVAQPCGARTWILRAMIGGRRRDMGLGGFPSVTLADARRKAREAREAIDKGGDPIKERRAAKARLLAESGRVVTFKDVAGDYLAAHEKGWSVPTQRAWANTLNNYMLPKLGKLAVGDIETSHVLEVLRPLWAEIPETGKRTRNRIEQILDSAKAAGHIKDPWSNPARWRGHLNKILAPPRKVAPVEHYPALPIDDMPAFMVKLATVRGMGASALEFIILTACRSGEARGATWAEIDLQKKLWVIPAARMKAKKDHRVPLSPAAVAALMKLPRIAGCDLVFPNTRGELLSDMSVSAVCRRLGVKAVPHGFRSTFRDFAGERTNFPREVAEAALAHSVGNDVEAAYRRGDALEKRRKLMEAWANFLSKPVAKPEPGGSNVIDSQAAGRAA
jgi:integrase